MSVLSQLFADHLLGDAGHHIIIEDYLEGQEISVLAFSDGYTVIPMPAAQDHKRVGDGDKGPNTGGMGAYAPAPVATPLIMRQVMKEILQPTIDGMRKDGMPFVGVIFAGIILTQDGPKVLEFNCRFGDPETECLLPLLDTDLFEIVLACVERRLDSIDVKWKKEFGVTVIAASQGYPNKYDKGKSIEIGNIPNNVEIFHAGTKKDALKGIVTNGGRVLAVSSMNSNLKDAINVAYASLDMIKFEGMFYRKDIGHRYVF